MATKERIDVLLTEQGHFESREKAKRAVMAGMIYINNMRIDKAGEKVDTASEIEVRGKKLAYVSRGGLKLEKAIKEYGVELTGKTCMDIGASTGGFTDCMLQNGASKVYSVDVGYGQLDWKLRNDQRVINMERTNIRYIEKESIDPLEFVSIDVSFISLKLVLPVAADLLVEGSQIVFLIKPQFEAGREKVKKNGVVRDRKVHEDVLTQVMTYADANKIHIDHIDFSPIKGPKGNIEFLGVGRYLGDQYDSNVVSYDIIKALVDGAHGSLNQKTL